MVSTVPKTCKPAAGGRRLRRAAASVVLAAAAAAVVTGGAYAQAKQAKPAKPPSSLILPLPKPPVPERVAPIYTPPASQPAAARAPQPTGESRILSARDRDLFTQAMRAASKRQWSQARQTAARASQPLVAKIIEWAYLREPGPHAGFLERTAFLAAHPDWPSAGEIQRQAEAMIDEEVSSGATVEWFKVHPPLTTDGKVAYAQALRAQGKRSEVEALIRDAWRTGTFDAAEEKEFLRDFGNLLTPEDHRARVDTILYQGQTTAAQRLLSRLDNNYEKVARARIALIGSDRNMDAAINAVPPELQNDSGLLFDRIRWRRERDKDDEARGLIPEFPLNSPRPDLWWRERHVLARDALAKGFITDAYRIARHHGASDPVSVSEAEWLAGWIALRFLKDGETALPHFEKMYDTVQTPLSLAKGAYWVGRTTEFLGRADIANEWYARAAAFPTTFYGQLAFSRLKGGAVPTLPQDPVPTAEERAKFEARELTTALKLILEIGEKRFQQPFAVALANASDLAADRHMVGELVSSYRRPDLGVVIARQAARDKFVLVDYGFPVPSYSFSDLPEKAFVLGIVRQETNFDYSAVNAASGARGLMQLMPPTARAVARSLKVRYEQPRLTTDPAYNLRLGSSYLQSMVKTSGGSYIVAAASYNAGPGRARQWVRQFGDPRDPGVDAIDWIEMIPFSETRNYVQRVMENVMVYRAILGGTRQVSTTLEGELARRE